MHFISKTLISPVVFGASVALVAISIVAILALTNFVFNRRNKTISKKTADSITMTSLIIGLIVTALLLMTI